MENQSKLAGPRFKGVKYSVIIPIFEQWDLVGVLFDALAQQTLSHDAFEIILIDNGSASPVPLTLEGLDVKYLECVTPGSYAARSVGVEHASGEWLVFTDADCRPAPDWLQRINEAISCTSGEDLLLAGAVEVYPAGATPTMYEVYDVVKGIRQDKYVQNGYAATANLTISKELYLKLGGFDRSLYSGGDIDLCRRAVSSGGQLTYEGTAKVFHPARSTWSQIKTKARRIKGGQLKKASGLKLVLTTLRSLLPPVNAIRNFLGRQDHSLKHRLIAVLVQVRIWMVEVIELVRLTLNSTAERR